MKTLLIALAVGLVLLPFFAGSQDLGSDPAITALNQTVDNHLSQRLQSLLEWEPIDLRP